MGADEEEWRARRNRWRRMGPLQELAIAPKTLERYATRVQRFVAELGDAGIVFPRAIWELDAELESAVCEMWWKGAPKGWAADLLSGVQHLAPWSWKKQVAS